MEKLSPFTSGIGYNVKLEPNGSGELSFTGVIAGDLETQNGGVEFYIDLRLKFFTWSFTMMNTSVITGI